jgi:hypothetical protein
MFNKIDNILRSILGEDYLVSTSNKSANNPDVKSEMVDVFKNSTASEISKIINSSEDKSLRFIMNHKGDYILWDAMKITHGLLLGNSGLGTANKYEKTKKEFNYFNDLVGKIYGKSTTYGNRPKNIYIYYDSAKVFYPKVNEDSFENREEYYEAIKNEFKKSKMYANMSRVGIEEIIIGKWE